MYRISSSYISDDPDQMATPTESRTRHELRHGLRSTCDPLYAIYQINRHV